ncbi:hypothetical protein HDU82_007588 [Entophlyctis luteolus]|nr:hypothetical protein HDU82_007588 [Entophlyctis luteolus]
MRLLFTLPTNATLEQLALVGSTAHACHPSVEALRDVKTVVIKPLVAGGNFPRRRVAILCGGGAGHEPAHAGFVADRMLSAAVSGAVFASPSSSQVFSAIEALARDGNDSDDSVDVLVLVKNYTGDRLAFGRAIERFKATARRPHSPRVDMVIVGEDCAIPIDRSRAGRRGLAGIIMVYKVAGELAARGASLNEVKAVAEAVAASVGTVGMALRDNGDTCELGLGIHGEQGYSVEPIMPIDLLAKTMVDMLVIPRDNMFSVHVDPSSHLVVMVNNLGSATDLETNAFLGIVLDYIKHSLPRLASIRIVVGRLMTSLHMHGLSLTLMTNAPEQILELLDAPAGPHCAWPGVTKLDIESFYSSTSSGQQSTRILPPAQALSETSVVLSDNESTIFQKCVSAAAKALISAEAKLTEYDVVSGDGDCGHTLTSGATAILGAVTTIPFCEPSAALATISRVLESSMGGSSGALYCILLDSASASWASQNDGSRREAWTSAFEAGVSAVMKYGRAEVGDRTMVDVLVPVLDALNTSSSDELIQNVRLAAEKGVEATAGMKSAKAGRASYVGSELTGVPDPGAAAVMIWTVLLCATIFAALALAAPVPDVEKRDPSGWCSYDSCSMDNPDRRRDAEPAIAALDARDPEPKPVAAPAADAAAVGERDPSGWCSYDSCSMDNPDRRDAAPAAAPPAKVAVDERDPSGWCSYDSCSMDNPDR